MLERWRNVFRRDRLNADLDDELQFHLAARAEEFTRDGLTPEQAEAKAPAAGVRWRYQIIPNFRRVNMCCPTVRSSTPGSPTAPTRRS